MTRKRLRIVHLPSTIGDNAYYLSYAEKQLGYTSHVYIFKSIKGTENIYSSGRSDYYISFRNGFEGALKILRFYIISIFKYDIFHFNAGMSLLYSDKFKLVNHLDLIFLKLFGKRIIVTYQGSSGRIVGDSIKRRITYFDEFDLLKSIKSDQIKKYRFKIVNSFADLIFSLNPDLLNALPSKARFRPYTKISPNEDRIRFRYFSDEIITIAHAPSDRKIKGTKFFESAVAKLRNEGYLFNVKLAQNIPKNEMGEFFSGVDILVDQLLIGWYGGVAVEAMAEGAAVVAYISEEDLKFLDSDFLDSMSIISAEPTNLTEVLRSLLDNRTLLCEYKKKSFEFFHSQHNIFSIAKIVLSYYESLYK